VVWGVDFSDDLDEEFWRQLFAEIGDFQDTVRKPGIRRRHCALKQLQILLDHYTHQVSLSTVYEQSFRTCERRRSSVLLGGSLAAVLALVLGIVLHLDVLARLVGWLFRRVVRLHHHVF
jgi:hypothetical protein